MFQIKVIAFTIIFTSVESLEELQGNGDVLNQIIHLLSKPAPIRRAVDPESRDKDKHLYRQLTKAIHKNILRTKADAGEDQTYAADKQAEEELKSSLQNKKSALLDRPRVESDGKRDFLVLGPNVFDAFVTVVPNAMYQRIEKKCVNWLDDCSLKGIRARLLRGVHSPYR